VLSGHTYRSGIKCLARFNDFLLSAAENIRIWDVNTGECLRVFELESSAISSIALTDQVVAASCHDKIARVWDLESGELLSTLKRHDAVLGHVQIDGHLIATGAADGGIGIWSKDTFELIHYIPPPIVEGPQCGSWGCVRGVVGFDFNNGVLLASGFAGVAKAANIENLPRFNTLGLPHRLIFKAKICDRKAYVLLSTDGQVCVEIWDLRGLNSCFDTEGTSNC